jgi:hypothetical protein
MTPAELDSSALKSSVAFTGRLACMTRAEAFEVVRQHGGTPSQAVTKRTKLLIVGELGWPLLDDGRPSNKLTRAKILVPPSRELHAVRTYSLGFSHRFPQASSSGPLLTRRNAE